MYSNTYSLTQNYRKKSKKYKNAKMIGNIKIYKYGSIQIYM